MNSRRITIQAPAKINLFLEVLRKRADGYHEIRSILHAIDLCDDVVIEERRRGITIECSDPSLPTDRGNLAWRAVELIQARAKTSSGAAVRLTKRIPVGAGLGGGSSDGAAVLKGLNTLWGLGLSSGELMRTAAGLGSDCAFFIPCGTALCEGRGEVVTPLPVRGPLRFALLCPPLSVSTALVYGNLTGKDLTEPRCDDSILKEALATGQAVKIGQELFNRLEAPAFRLFKGLSAAKEQLSSACPAGVLMTGSGSALFGIGESASEVKEAARRVESLGLGAAIAVSSWSSEQTIAMVQGGRHEDNRCARPSSRKTR